MHAWSVQLEVILYSLMIHGSHIHLLVAYVPEKQVGSCDDFKCVAGFTDHDANAATPCQSCESVRGLHVPSGSSGELTNLVFVTVIDFGIANRRVFNLSVSSWNFRF